MGQEQTKVKDNFQVTFDFVKTPITQIADYIIIAASKQNASDIHFDPRENGMMIRLRIDGDLQDYSFIPKAYERNLVTRLKLLANMNITESRLPQDGAIKGTFGDQYLDMRVSCLPLNEGEKIVIRILDYSRSLQGIDSLGFHPKNLTKLKRMMGTPNGIILVTGATGSGKSTTTYSILQGLNTPETNIITVEDPIEMNIQGINQVQVNAEIGMTFAAALRSILRQDPNIILIGEIRDSETAQIAVRSAITGHLVLSTIHTNNSLSTIERLLDMDVERYLLSTALVGIISQRLAKRICPKCRIQRKTTPYEQKIFRNFLKLDVKTIWDANPDGCDNCRNGYKGRIAIQEVLELDDEIRSALTIEGLSKDKLRKMVYTDKTITLLQDALLKCLDGLTNFEEVYRVIEMENDDEEDYKSELTSVIHEAITDDAPPTATNNIETVNNYNLNVNTANPSQTNNETQQQLPNVVENLQNAAQNLVDQTIQNNTSQQVETENTVEIPTVQTEGDTSQVHINEEIAPDGENSINTNIVEIPSVSSQETAPIDNMNTEATSSDITNQPDPTIVEIPGVSPQETAPIDNTNTEATSSDVTNQSDPTIVEIPGVNSQETAPVDNTYTEVTSPDITNQSDSSIVETPNTDENVSTQEESNIEENNSVDGPQIINNIDDYNQSEVMVSDDGIVPIKNDYVIYDFKNDKPMDINENLTTTKDEINNMTEDTEQNENLANEPTLISNQNENTDDIEATEDKPIVVPDKDTDNIDVSNQEINTDEDKREPIGSDFVDETGPLLEEIPRLGTEFEEDFIEDDIKDITPPQYVKE